LRKEEQVGFFLKYIYAIVLIVDWHQDYSCAARTPYRFQGFRSKHTSW
jgi:hypothetical protein